MVCIILKGELPVYSLVCIIFKGELTHNLACIIFEGELLIHNLVCVILKGELIYNVVYIMLKGEGWGLISHLRLLYHQDVIRRRTGFPDLNTHFDLDEDVKCGLFVNRLLLWNCHKMMNVRLLAEWISTAVVWELHYAAYKVWTGEGSWTERYLHVGYVIACSLPGEFPPLAWPDCSLTTDVDIALLAVFYLFIYLPAHKIWAQKYDIGVSGKNKTRANSLAVS